MGNSSSNVAMLIFLFFPITFFQSQGTRRISQASFTKLPLLNTKTTAAYQRSLKQQEDSKTFGQHQTARQDRKSPRTFYLMGHKCSSAPYLYLIAVWGEGGCLLALAQDRRRCHPLCNLLDKHSQEGAFPQRQCPQPQAVGDLLVLVALLIYFALQIIPELQTFLFLLIFAASIVLSIPTVLIRSDKLL